MASGFRLSAFSNHERRLNADCEPLTAPLEAEFVFFHIDADAAEGDAFHLKAESLLGSVLAGELDGSAGADDALPRQAGNLTKNADNLARRSGPTGGTGDRSVG